MEQIRLGELWMKAHYNIGIVNMITQRLKDIELQRWLISEINNDTRKDANQGNKMRTYRLLKTTIKNVKIRDGGRIPFSKYMPCLPGKKDAPYYRLFE